jgi:hypothetical protein
MRWAVVTNVWNLLGPLGGGGGGGGTNCGGPLLKKSNSLTQFN